LSARWKERKKEKNVEIVSVEAKRGGRHTTVGPDRRLQEGETCKGYES